MNINMTAIILLISSFLFNLLMMMISTLDSNIINVVYYGKLCLIVTISIWGFIIYEKIK